MADIAREGIARIIKYVSTPAQLIAVCVLVVGALLYIGDFTELQKTILVCVLALTVIVAVGIALCDPKRLQLTGEQHIMLERMHLGDSRTGITYVDGNVAEMGEPDKNPNETPEV